MLYPYALSRVQIDVNVLTSYILTSRDLVPSEDSIIYVGAEK